jgi:3-deoxy-7-phosphoheptulonate synthase
MKPTKTFDLNIAAASPLIAPKALKKETPLSPLHTEEILESRRIVRRIIRGEDTRLLAIVGPCSIHDRKAAIEYAERIASIRKEIEDRIFMIMRVYFEKPRTVLGWRGLITDPHLDGSYDIAFGLRRAREILLSIIELGVPAGSEMLDPIVPQYIDDLISWAAIGARTTESQTHREMASGLSMPVGFKNSTDGSFVAAVNALKSSTSSHSFIGIDQNGNTSVLTTRGNPEGHIISRGGSVKPNYHRKDLQNAIELLDAAEVKPAILVDCSHGNSGKKHVNQETVLHRLLADAVHDDMPIIGFMIESNLFEGRQPIPADLTDLRYGISITDECVGWETTKRMLRYAYDAWEVES